MQGNVTLSRLNSIEGSDFDAFGRSARCRAKQPYFLDSIVKDTSRDFVRGYNGCYHSWADQELFEVE